MPHILVVDDEPDLIWAVRYSLQDEGYEVSTAANGAVGLRLARAHRPDLVILDVAMPEMDGMAFCRQIRRDPGLAAVPVLFLSMQSAVEDRISGLEEGGDDYLAKPFDLRELKARVRALLRRERVVPAPPAKLNPPHAALVVGALALDLDTRTVQIDQKSIALTPAEFDLLRFMMANPDKVFSSAHLLTHVWGYAPEVTDPSLVRWHIRNLRAKLAPAPDAPVYIRTVPRHGYMLVTLRTD
ncbi:MAG: response regulator transcription factor [Roseiflexaceae bacterium]|nr:response regulator transcription factor [Roseiflexaceae bacterium]